jgi:hypothetical protein
VSLRPRPREYAKAEFEIAGGVSWDAVAALTFVSDPAMWPAFAAWADQVSGPGDPFTEADRQRMAIAARLLLEFAEKCDQIVGEPQP